MSEYGKIHTDGSRSGGQPLVDSIEAKALALANEVLAEWGVLKKAVEVPKNSNAFSRALLRAIEQHEAFKQEVSDVMTYIRALYPTLPRNFDRFIIPKPKPDPLVEALVATDGLEYEPQAQAIRAALKACGFEIREKAQ
jgi:hypothetical protein